MLDSKSAFYGKVESYEVAFLPVSSSVVFSLSNIAGFEPTTLALWIRISKPLEYGKTNGIYVHLLIIDVALQRLSRNHSKGSLL